MDDTIALVAWWMLLIVSLSPIWAAGIIAIWWHATATLKEEHKNRSCKLSEYCDFRPWPWKLHGIIFAIAVCGWLWVPWAALAGVKVYRANWNAVNYVSRPDTVTPVPGRTIRADEAPVEGK